VKKVLGVIFGTVVLVVGATVATNKIMNRPTQSVQPASKPLADDNYRKKIVTAYINSQNLSQRMGQRELTLCIADKECSSIRTDLQAAVSDTNHLADETQKALNLKPGTSFTVNTDRGSVDFSEPK
jgi:hypothetical protein